jgi:hypothetical protein
VGGQVWFKVIKISTNPSFPKHRYLHK